MKGRNAKIRKKGASDRAIFDSIRKPTAPPSRRFGDDKPEERARPAERKIKHKKRRTKIEE